MKLKSFLLLFFPIAIMAQDNSDWITPVANIEFKDNLVVYTCQVSEPGFRLEPLFITDKFIIIFSPQTGYPVADNLFIIREWLTDQVSSFPAEGSPGMKELYLKACALYIIWNIGGEKLPDEALEQRLALLEQDMNTTISHQATLVKQLYESILEGMKKIKMRKR